MRVMVAAVMLLCGCAQILGIEDPTAGEPGGPDAADGETDAPDADDTVCTGGAIEVRRDDPTIAFLVDRTASMVDTNPLGVSRWQGAVDAVDDVAARFDDLVPFAATWFRQLNPTPCVEQYGLTPQLGNGAAIAGLLAGVEPDGYGGQFGAAIDTQVAQLGGPGVIVLLTDSQPSSCDGVADGSIEARDAALAAQRAGVTVHVLAIGNDMLDFHLQQIADAGGGLGRRATDLATMEAGFAEILATAISCDFTTEPALDTLDADQLVVRWDGVALAQGDDGWQIVGDRLVLSGAACDAFRARDAGAALEVERSCP